MSPKTPHSSPPFLPILMACLVSLLMVFQNCGGNEFRAKFYGEALSGPIQYPSPFADKKLVLDTSFVVNQPVVFSGGLSKAAPQTLLESNRDLVVFIKNSCAAQICDQKTNSLPCQAYANGQPDKDLANQAYDYRLTENRTEAQLSAWISAPEPGNECLIGVTNSSEMILGATPLTNDPLGNQSYFDQIGYWETFSYFNASLWSIPIGIVDSGTNPTHEDLANVLLKYNTVGTDPNDCIGHGSMVAGIIGATQYNNKGALGISGANIYVSDKAFDCSTTTSITQIVNAINRVSTWCSPSNPGVINLSFSGKSGETALAEAISTSLNRGCVIVVAAGNDAQDLEVSPVFPAALSKTYRGLITVGSVTVENKLSSFSNHSAKFVDIAAPGEDIYAPDKDNGTYRQGSGTSFAAPIVTGAIANMLSVFQRNKIPLTPALAEEIFLRGATNTPDLDSFVVGGRRLNLIALKAEVEKTIKQLTSVQIGFGEAIPDGTGFRIPITFDRTASGYVIELVEIFSGERTVIGSYNVTTTQGRTEFALAVVRPEKSYSLVVRDTLGNIVTEIPIPKEYFFKPDLGLATPLGTITQIYPEGNGFSGLVLEGWTCIKEYAEPVDIEIWLDAVDTGVLAFSGKAAQRARGDFYERCKDSLGRPHPRIDVGFFYRIPDNLRSYTAERKVFVRAKNPAGNKDKDVLLGGSGDFFLPPRSETATLYHSIQQATRNPAGQVTVKGWACNNNRNERVTVNLVVKSSEISTYILPPLLEDNVGAQTPVPATKGIAFGTRGGCGGALPFPIGGALCSHSDIDGESRVFQDFISSVFEPDGYLRLAGVVAHLPSASPATSCYNKDLANFELVITDPKSIFSSLGYFLPEAEIPPGGKLITPTLLEQTTNILSKAPLYLQIKSSSPLVPPKIVPLSF